MQSCAVCQQQTDKCCSLCFKIFYCSPSHQQVHWHMTHKYSCEGRQLQIEQKQDQFRIYGQSVVKSGYKTANSNEQDAKTFLSLFNDRLELRKIVLAKYLAARQSNSPPLLNKQLVREAQELSAFSNKVSEHYRTGLSQNLDEEFGLITNSFIIKHDELLDRILLARCYQLTLMQKELKESLIYLSNEVETYPESLTPQFAESYKRTLMAVLDLSESMNFDKVSEKMYANFIRLVQRMEGIWQQAYAYFNMGLWYARKTYYLKALKCFNYAFQLVLSNKASRETSDNATIFKGDAVYNIALCIYSTGKQEKALESMQEAYRLRAQGLGKSSIEASDCLYTMARWSLAEKNYENCLQYATQCLRIRKVNPSFQRQLQQINSLIGEMYESIRRDRQQSGQVGNSKNERYLQRLLEGQSTFRESQERESFTKRLLESEKQMVTFKLIITPELADTFTSLQWSKVGDLIDLVDTKMEKEQAIRLMLESQFSQLLTEEQRTVFIKLNKFV